MINYLRRLLNAIIIIFVTIYSYYYYCCHCHQQDEAALQEKFAWNLMNFQVNINDETAETINNNNNNHHHHPDDFIQENNIPFGIEIWRNKLFVTIPRRNKGVLSTLNYVPLDSESRSPLLIPYPNLQANRISEDGIVSVFRIYVDICDRLWIVDTGSVAELNGDKRRRIHNSRIHVFNLMNDSVIWSYEIPDEQINDDTAFTNIVVEVMKSNNEAGKTCNENNDNDAFAYIADPGSYALLVYHFQSNKSWRIKHAYFHIDPFSSNFNVAGFSFNWDDGIFGISLINNNNNDEEEEEDEFELYFHPMSSTYEFGIPTKYLKNETIAIKSKDGYRIVGHRGQLSQATSSSYHRNTSILFYPLINQNAIACWSTKNNNAGRYSSKNTRNDDVVAKDDERLIYPSDLKVHVDDLWVITNKLPVLLYGKLNYNDTNFRILTAPISSLINGSLCKSTTNIQ